MSRAEMTTPFERTRALVLTKELLQRLSSLGDDAIPIGLAAEAEALLRHFPTLQDIELAHKSNPEIFGPAPPFQPVAQHPEIRGVLDPARTARESGLTGEDSFAGLAKGAKLLGPLV